MKLDYEQIKSICTGAVRVEESEEGICFFRFTKEQEELYRKQKPEFNQKILAAAGMRLSFDTDSEELFMKVRTAQGSSRQYFSFDISVDGKIVDHLDNFSDKELPHDYTKCVFEQGVFAKGFALGSGRKRVCIYMPWSASVVLQELSLADASYVIPVRQGKKLLVFGDSITQGYDALRPSNRYAAKVADMLQAEELNKAIGGEKFFPQLAQTRDDIRPDYIIVAYGSNDWNGIEEELFIENCSAFYEGISQNYPYSKIFAITPIWRKDRYEPRKFGAFEKVEANIRKIVDKYPNIICIRGYEFVPHEEGYFADLRLHPNDKGFEHYARNLCVQIKDML